jgi:hypothetical protein
MKQARQAKDMGGDESVMSKTKGLADGKLSIILSKRC